MKIKKALYKTVSVLAAAVLLLCMVPVTMLPTLASDENDTSRDAFSHPATVTLLDGENGSASLDGTDETVLTVNTGDTVTVRVTPDEGYFCDSLGVWAAEGSDAEAMRETPKINDKPLDGGRGCWYTQTEEESLCPPAAGRTDEAESCV